jgi:predicted ATP-dependent protease
MFFKRLSKDKSVPASAPATELPKSDPPKNAPSIPGAPEPLPASNLRAVIDPKSLGFKSTAELKPPEGLIGQERALKALEFGLAMPGPEFNVFVVGPPSSGRRTSVKATLNKVAKDRETPPDWAYVHNFADPDRPRALKLPHGQGRKLRAAMADAMSELSVTLPAAFDSEEYRARRSAIDEQYHAGQSDVIEALHQKAAAQNIAIVRTPLGFGMAPMHGGKVVKPEVFNQLPDNMRREVEARIGSLQKELEANLAEAPAANRLRRQHIADLDEDFARAAVEAALDDVSEQFSELPEVSTYVAAVEDDLVTNAGANRDVLRTGGEAAARLLRRYAVNVVISHEAESGVPIVEDTNPTAPSLMGRIEHVTQQGALAQDFTKIKAGSLLRANGGYLILDAGQITSAPAAWSWLKRALASKAIAIETAGEPGNAGLARTIEPEPIPLDVKVILIGNRDLYQRLTDEDPDFARLFKVQADFHDAVVRSKETDKDYARLIASVVATHDLKPVEAAGVARLMEEATRIAEDRDRLSLDVGRLTDIAREADLSAREAKHDTIKREDIQRAIESAADRAARPRDRAQDSLTRGFVLVDTDGDKVGQINALSLQEDGFTSYGRPSRITARVHVGQGRVTDIEREAQLGGALHSKGVMILWGHLAGRFAQESPLSLAASLVFEQSYATVEGDSAASAELYALLSALADAPIRQGLAVTGSVNQCGDVQAVGGINEKIEGFFDLCKARGLTGTQGVLIPRANVQNLMLREDIVEAAKEKKFSVHAVSTIDEGIALLTGVAAGERQSDGSYPAASLNGRVQARLKAFADRARYFNGGAGKPGS